jgi:hypothetical protein
MAGMIAPIAEVTPHGYVYILHFRTPVAGGRKQSRHYVGFSIQWHWRINQHRCGHGAALTRELYRRGLAFDVAVVVDRIICGQLAVTGVDMERLIKASHQYRRYCPLCGSARLIDYREGHHDARA